MDVKYNPIIHGVAQNILAQRVAEKQYLSDCLKAEICPACGSTLKDMKCSSCNYEYDGLTEDLLNMRGAKMAIRKITEEEAGPDWNERAIWAEYGSPNDFIVSLNIALASHNLELVEVDAKLSDIPLLLKSTVM